MQAVQLNTRQAVSQQAGQASLCPQAAHCTQLRHIFASIWALNLGLRTQAAQLNAH